LRYITLYDYDDGIIFSFFDLTIFFF